MAELFKRRCPRGHIHKQRESCAVCAEMDRARLHASGVASVEHRHQKYIFPAADEPLRQEPPAATSAYASAFESAHRQLSKDAARLACTHDFDELTLLCSKRGACAFNEMWLSRKRSHRGRSEPVAGCNCSACEMTARFAVRAGTFKIDRVDDVGGEYALHDDARRTTVYVKEATLGRQAGLGCVPRLTGGEFDLDDTGKLVAVRPVPGREERRFVPYKVIETEAQWREAFGTPCPYKRDAPSIAAYLNSQLGEPPRDFEVGLYCIFCNRPSRMNEICSCAEAQYR